LTFKENCPDIRNSRVIDVVHELVSYGANVHVHDPVADPAGSATGSCTCTLAPYETSSWTTSMTRELRMSGQFSLNVRPRTLMSAPLTDAPDWISCLTVC